MRVLQVIRPASGGMRAHLLLLARGLTAQGVEVGVVSPAAELNAEAGKAGAATFMAAIGDRPSPADLAALLALDRAVRSFAPDLLHAHGLRAAWLARPVARIRHLPAVVTYHATLDGGGSLRRAVTLLLERLLAPWTAQAIAVSEMVRSDLLARAGLPPEAVRTILNGADLAAGVPRVSREDVRRSLGVPAGVPAVITVARLAPQKDLPTLLRAAAKVIGAIDAHFLLVGDGPLRRELEETAKNLGLAGRTHFLGYRDDVPVLLQACDLFALSSAYEGAPLAVIEALAAGLPVVATAVGGLPELVPEGRAGYLVRAGDHDSLAERILTLCSRPDLRLRLGQKARSWAAARLGPEIMVADTFHLYEKVLRTGWSTHRQKKPTLVGGQ